METQSKFIEIEGSPLHFIEAGKGSPILFAGGYLCDALAWASQVTFFSPHRRVIVPELWGHGMSGAMPAHTSSFADVARQHIKLLDALEIERCTIVGQSMGGMWGATLALLAPHRVSELVLIGTSLAAEPDEARESYLQMLDGIEASGFMPEQVIALVLSLFHSSETRALRPGIVTSVAARLRAWDSARMLDSVVPLGRMIFDRPEALAELTQLSMRTLVLTGVEDHAQPPAEGRRMAKTIGCPFVEIPHAAHVASVDAPDAFNRILADFLPSPAALHVKTAACVR